MDARSLVQLIEQLEREGHEIKWDGEIGIDIWPNDETGYMECAGNGTRTLTVWVNGGARERRLSSSPEAV